jgi:hypothetical protein
LYVRLCCIFGFLLSELSLLSFPEPYPLPFENPPTDDFKMVVVEAIRALCLKFPAKHRSLMNFLSNILREEGGFEYKKSIVNAILALIQVRQSVLWWHLGFWEGFVSALHVVGGGGRL